MRNNQRINGKKQVKSKTSVDLFSNFDIRVFYVFFVFMLFGAILISLKRIDYVDCSTAEFQVIGERFTTEEVITFENHTPNARKYEWDFGDGSPKESRYKEMHQYKEPGVYLVRLKINNSCVIEQQVEIAYQEQIINKAEVPIIVVPEFAQVGEPVSFNFIYEGDVQTAEWSFGESGDFDVTNPNPKYAYKTNGDKTISLIINGDFQHMAKATIKITNSKPKGNPKPVIHYPPPPVPQPRPVPKPSFGTDVPTITAPDVGETTGRNTTGNNTNGPSMGVITQPNNPPVRNNTTQPDKNETRGENITSGQVQSLLSEVAANRKVATDFSPYTCEQSVPVNVNGDLMPLSTLCSKIRGKKIRVNSVHINKNDKNCITNMQISLEVKKTIGWRKDLD